jgi:hypothetical protein
MKHLLQHNNFLEVLLSETVALFVPSAALASVLIARSTAFDHGAKTVSYRYPTCCQSF